MKKRLHKLISSLSTILLGNIREFGFEDRFALGCFLYVSIVFFIAFFGNNAIGLGSLNGIFILSSSVIFMTCYFIARIYHKFELAKSLFSILAFIFCSLYWYFNYGSKGAALYTFVVYYSMMIFLWSNRHLIIIIALIFLNLIGLFILELLYPNLIPTYPNELARITDNYISILAYLGFLLIITLSAKHNYLTQYKLAQQADRLKSAFLSNMSHEIRTPLNAIIGFSQLLAKRELTKEKKMMYSELINENGNYLMRLMSDILDISLIESGQLKLVSNPIDLTDLFKRLYTIHERNMKDLKKKDLKIKLNIPSNPVFVISDEFRITQIISNLMNNAIKFTSNGYIKIGFTPTDSNVVCFVEDTGCGVAPHVKDKIFDRFVKTDDDVNIEMNRGAGIGLSLSSELVSKLGGKIWFTSEVMNGSTFYFTLPKEIQN